MLTQIKGVLDYYRSSQVPIRYLSDYLGGTDSVLTLYTMFSSLFSSDSVVTDEDMAFAVVSGLIFDSDDVYCVLYENSVCWFRLQESHIKKLGTMYFNEPYSSYSCGKFVKELRYRLALEGYNLNKVHYLVWDTLPIIYRDYISCYTSLSLFFNKIRGLTNKSCSEVLTSLSRGYSEITNISSEVIVNAISDSSEFLELKNRNGVLQCRRVFFKDFSSIIASKKWSKSASYGIILDCEGVSGDNGALQNGCREIGGIIYRNDGGLMYSVYTFIADSLILEDTLCRVVDAYKSITGSVIPKRGIDVYVFGKSDVIMINNTFEKFSRKGRNYLKNRFNFIDSMSTIHNYLRCNGIRLENRKKSLSNIATRLGVRVIRPKHNSLSDARTLFNVLAYIKLTERSSNNERKVQEYDIEA